MDFSFTPYLELLAIPILSIIFIVVVLAKKTDIGTRENIFLKISEEYGLRMERPKYPWYDDKAGKIRLSVAGRVRGHDVQIADFYSNWTLNPSNTAFLKFRTEMTVDGVTDTFNKREFVTFLPLDFDHPASYEQIRTALDNLSHSGTVFDGVSSV